MRHSVLTIIVIDFDVIKSLEVSKVTEEKVGNSASHGNLDLRLVLKLRKPKRDTGIANWEVAKEDAERREQAFPAGNTHARTILVTSHERTSMKRYVGQLFIPKRLLVTPNLLGEWLGLLVQDQGNKRIAVAEVVRTRLVDEAAYLSQGPSQRKSRGKAPALGGHPIGIASLFILRQEPLWTCAEVPIHRRKDSPTYGPVEYDEHVEHRWTRRD